MKILYGTQFYSIDITKMCFNLLIVDNEIVIPRGDINRIKLFSDPVPSNIKYIYIVKDNLNYITYQYSDIYTIKINVITNEISHHIKT